MEKQPTTKKDPHYAMIIIVVLCVIASSVFLAWVEQSQRAPHGWWAVYFIDPHANAENFDFVIENYTDNSLFSYIIGDAPSKEVAVPYGMQERISLDKNESEKSLITITHNGKVKTIEK